MNDTTNRAEKLLKQGRSVLLIALVLFGGVGLMALLPHGAPPLVYAFLWFGIAGLCFWAVSFFASAKKLRLEVALERFEKMEI